MRSKTVKGFTLIELIVVMAIFGLILATAMLLYRPSAKMMVESSVQESAQAVLTNVGTYLESEFASVERIDSYDTLGSRDGRVLDFAKKYYEGILRNGSDADPATAKYGSGQIHVMEIINDESTIPDPANPGSDKTVINSVIRTYVYNCNFATGAVTAVENTGLANPSALNQAYYQDNVLTIRLGEYDDTNWDDTTPPTISQLRSYVHPGGMSFSIKAESRRQFNGNVYNNYKAVTIPLVNILNMPVGSSYYGLNESVDSATGAHTYNITGLANVSNQEANSVAATPVTLNASRELNPDSNYRDTKLVGSATDPITSYMFIYSYGAEIDTTAAP